MVDEIVAATHSTAPWYFILIPLGLVLVVRLSRRGSGGGPFRRGPFSGPGNGLSQGPHCDSYAPERQRHKIQGCRGSL